MHSKHDKLVNRYLALDVLIPAELVRIYELVDNLVNSQTNAFNSILRHAQAAIAKLSCWKKRTEIQPV